MTIHDVEHISCPKCNEETFRRLDIHNNHILWKCKRCSYTETEKLFPIRKKVIYLDQFVYSLFLKSSKKEDKWKKLGDKLNELIEDQIIVCPYSTIHQTETEFYKTYFTELTKLYRKYSLGIEFNHPFEIEQHQLIHSLNNFLYKKESSAYKPIWRHGIEKDPHQWASRLSLFVNININLSEINRVEKLKKETCKKIQKRYDEIYKEEMKSFNKDYDIEKGFLAEVIISNHRKNEELTRDIMLGNRPMEAYFELLNDHVEWMLPQINASGEKNSNPFNILIEFLSSEEFYQTPYVRIWAYLFAALDQKVRASGRRAQEGDYYDIRAISNFLPYCDVMIIDNEFRGLLEERGAPLTMEFDTLIISGKTLDSLYNHFAKWIASTDTDKIRDVYNNLDRDSFF
ncbi:MAG: hypothetical protein KKG88_10575 [Proteobacteria bacterium]|nr:hypothetical protein [Pseudomonadota bacterium]